MRYVLNKDTEYPHTIILEPFNEEGLIKRQKLAVLDDPVLDWLRENFDENDAFVWYLSGIIGFRTKEDAMAFKLRWA